MIGVDVSLDKTENMGPKSRAAVIEYLKTGADRGLAIASDEVPVDRGAGGGLLGQMFEPEVQGDTVVWGVRDAPHARPIEYGTEPGHTPPVTPLVEWAERIGKSEGFGIWVATQKIPEDGIEPNPYMEPGREAQIRWYQSHSVQTFLDRELR